MLNMDGRFKVAGLRIGAGPIARRVDNPDAGRRRFGPQRPAHYPVQFLRNIEGGGSELVLAIPPEQGLPGSSGPCSVVRELARRLNNASPPGEG